MAKLPSKVTAAIGGLAWRAHDLAELAHELFGRKRVVPAIVLTRSVMECSALVYLVHKKVEQALRAGAQKELDDFIVSCLSGNRNDPNDPRSPNVLTAIGHLEKELGADGFTKFYNVLSEFAHPNALGGFYAYAEFLDSERRLVFGHNRGLTKASDAAFGLAFALEVLIDFYDRTIARLPDVSELAVRSYPDT